jgi:hypothetical protein
MQQHENSMMQQQPTYTMLNAASGDQQSQQQFMSPNVVADAAHLYSSYAAAHGLF